MTVDATLRGNNKKPSYPKLMMNSDGMIVLFTSATKGTVVRKSHGNCGYAVGFHTGDWGNVAAFEDYKGQVVLENQND